MTRPVRSSAFPLLLLLLAACGAPAAPLGEPSREPPPVPPTVVATFSGEVDPVTGVVTIRTEPTPAGRGAGMTGLSVQAGVAAANVPGSLWSNASGHCAATSTGAEVTLTSSASSPRLHDTWAVVTWISGTGSEGCNTIAIPAPVGFSTSLGAWYYGTLDPGVKSSPVPWAFAFGSGAATTFTGVILATDVAPTLEVACSGTGCGALGSTQYAGSGVGLWRHRNLGATTETIDVSLSGVAAGNKVALVFSNGSTSDSAVLPSGGVLATPAMADLALASPLPIDPLDEPRQLHLSLSEENRAVARELASMASLPGAPARSSLRAPTPPRAAVALGDHRTWNELINSKSYDTVAKASCDLVGGRKAVFWVDPASTANGNVTDADLTYFTTTFCGASSASTTGGYARVRAISGEPWGNASAIGYTGYIPDSPLQDVNVVFLEASSTSWAGYFWGKNNVLRSVGASYASSNEALAFFVDATQVHTYGTSSRSYLGSTLLHELTHMVNFWQRNVLRGVGNDTWLEETTAAMTEDVVTPVATPDSYLAIPSQRVRPYVTTGGNISLLLWTYPAENSYSIGGSLAAFLDRRYGTAIQSGIIGCSSGNVACLDGVIRANGGQGFEEDFGRMGASIWGLLPATSIPGGYGFPARTWNGYDLVAIDISSYSASRPATARSLGTAFRQGSHTYVAETVAAGKTTYSRTGVVVPAHTTLLVVVRP